MTSHIDPRVPYGVIFGLRGLVVQDQRSMYALSSP
jgi:hypothetical protein